MARHILLDTATHAATVDGAPVSLRPKAAQHIKAVYGKGYRLGESVMKRLKAFRLRRSVAT